MEIRSKFKKSEFFIGGNFNLPDIDWTKSEIKEGRYKIEINGNFLEACSDARLSQVVDEPTRKDNILDIF